MAKPIVLTGDRPTGKLHLGHYVGSLQTRLTLQETHEQYIMVADMQALTDHADQPQTITRSITEVVKDYIAIGLDPTRSTIFVQSAIGELFELTMYFMNLVTVSRLERNPTVKHEIAQKGYHEQLPVGFYCYPISQAADILAFQADIVPVGDDQLPMIELANEIARKFNRTYQCEVFHDAHAQLSAHTRLCGIDGKAKASKSLGNAIYLSDDSQTVREKVFSMYTDPNHIHVQDPGSVEGNVVFTYLDVFHPEKDTISNLKDHYTRGGLGDVSIKKLLFETLEDFLSPIRSRRALLSDGDMHAILMEGNKKAREKVRHTMQKVRHSIGLTHHHLG
jgi:tryptophanyl-tRNA synthetase